MYPSNFAEIISNPNWMWRRIETSMKSQETWTCPIKLGKKKRNDTKFLITTPEELLDIQRIRAELRYSPMVMDPAQVEPVLSERETAAPSFAHQTPEQFRGTCQFCDAGVSTLQCSCEMGMLLRTIWKSSVESTSTFPWERVRRLLDDAEDSTKKRQKRDLIDSTTNESVFAKGRTLESPRSDRRKLFSTMDSTHSSIDTRYAEAPNEEQFSKSVDNKRSDMVHPISSLFDGRLVSASGDFHLQQGAQEYGIYLEQAIQLCGRITDCKLSQNLDEETRVGPHV